MTTTIFVNKFVPICDVKSCKLVPTAKITSDGSHIGVFCDEHKEEIIKAHIKFHEKRDLDIDKTIKVIRNDK